MPPTPSRPLAAEGSQIWLGHFLLHDGMEEAWADLSAEMVEQSRAEPGTFAYHHHHNSDGSIVAYERYFSLAAAWSHLDRFEMQYATRMQATVAHRRVFIAESSPQVRDRIVDLGAEAVRADRRECL